MATFKRQTGSGWEHISLPVNIGMSPQTLAYAEVTANQGSITAEVDLTGLSVNVVVPAGRRLRIRGQCRAQSTVADDTFRLSIKEGGTALNLIDRIMRPANTDVSVFGDIIISPSAGAHTYKLTGARGNGTGTHTMSAGASAPASILVEDITGSTLPYQPASVPVGVLAQAIDTTYIPTITSAGRTLLTTNIVVPAGRILKVTAGSNVMITSANGRALGNISLDGVVVGRWIDRTVSTANHYASASDSILISPSAGAHRIVMDISGIGAATLDIDGGATVPTHLFVEDVTPTPAPSNGAPSSTLGYAEVIANQGTFTAETDITGLSTTITVPAGRRLRITAQTLPQSSVATDKIRLRIKEGATTLQFSQGEASPQATTLVASVIISPSAGSHTYKVSLSRDTGTGNITNNADPTFPSFILVEDITGSVWPEGSEVTAGMVASEAWTDYVPTNSNITVGNGTQQARYIKIGRKVTVTYRLSFGSTTSFAAGFILIGLPFAASTAAPYAGSAVYQDSGTRNFVGSVICNISSVSQMNVIHTESGNNGNVGPSDPFTWVSGDALTATITYEAAS